MCPFNMFLEITRAFVDAVSLLTGVATSLSAVYDTFKKVRGFVIQKMRKEPSGGTDGSSDLDDHDLS